MEERMLVSKYRIELEEGDSEASLASFLYSKAFIDSDVSDVMPYLNVELESAFYSGDKRFIIWNEQGYKVSLKPTELTINPVSCMEEAKSRTKSAMALINDVWYRRVEIDPSAGVQSLPTPHELWKLLSGKNCGCCGFKSCMVFAAELIEGNVQPEQCVHLRLHNSNHLEAV